uniref:Kinesin motor domain-containing protein n=1 Tax=Macrostomum lignano TaxID=282301 RepID=A0A1I8FGR2_9PLAT
HDKSSWTLSYYGASTSERIHEPPSGQSTIKVCAKVVPKGTRAPLLKARSSKVLSVYSNTWLASERQSVAGTTGTRLREGSNINRSLLTLGKVISLLSERVANEAGVNSSAKKSNNQHIPYRESYAYLVAKGQFSSASRTGAAPSEAAGQQQRQRTVGGGRRPGAGQCAPALEISDLRDQLQAANCQAEELENWKLARLQAEAVKENCPAASSDTAVRQTPKVSATISTSPPVSAAVVNPAAPSTPLRHRQLSIVDGGCTASANLRRLEFNSSSWTSDGYGSAEVHSSGPPLCKDCCTRSAAALAKEAAAASIAICCRQLAPLIYAGRQRRVSTFLSWLAARQCPTTPWATRLLASLRRRGLASGSAKRCANLRRLLSLRSAAAAATNVVGGLADVAEALDDFVGSVDCLLADAAGSAAFWLPAGRPKFDCACGDDADHGCCEERAGDGAAADADGSRWSRRAPPTAPRRRSAGALNPEAYPCQHSTSESTGSMPVRILQHSRAVVSHCQQTLRYLEILLGGSQLEIITVRREMPTRDATVRLRTWTACQSASCFDSSIEPSRACLRRLKLTLEAACVKAAELVISGRNRHQRR